MEQQFRVIIAGTRDFSNYDLMCSKMDTLLKNRLEGGDEIVVVCGMARGADALGYQYAMERGFEVKEFPADWDKFGRRAGILRNREMAKNADAVVAFWDGVSRGTRDMIEVAKQNGLSLRVVKYT